MIVMIGPHPGGCGNPRYPQSSCIETCQDRHCVVIGRECRKISMDCELAFTMFRNIMKL